MFRSLTTRGLPKPFAILIAALLALYFVPLGALPANANASGNTTFGGFEMDGNFYEGTANVTTATGPTGDPVDWGSDDIKSQVDVVEDPLESSDPTVFANGSKETDPDSWKDESSAQAPGKGDIGNLYVYDRLLGGDQYLFLAFERESSSGTVTYWLELNQKTNTTNANGAVVPNRSIGDLRLAVSQAGNGAFAISSVRQWNGVIFTEVTPPAGSFALQVNDSQIQVGDLPKWTNVSRAEKYFVEASFNLSTLGVDLECPSTGFASAFLRSQSSQENANPELKDYTTGPVNVPSNCSQFKIEKRKGTVDGELLPGATFAITPNPFPGQTQPDPAIVTDGGAGDADGTANGTVLINPAKPGTYTVSEETAPVGYIKETGTKQVAAQAYAQAPAVLVFTNDLGKAEWEKRDKTSGALVCCATFHVEGIAGAALTKGYDAIVKDDEDANTTVETGTTADDRNDAAGQIRLNDLYTGTYRVTEVSAPSGYDLSSPTVKTFTIDSTTLNTVLTGSASNTGTAGAFVDERLTPDVSAVKRDTDANGATLAGASFELFVDNAPKGQLDPSDVSVTGHGTNPQPTGANGLATWTDLGWGDYLIVEQAAPTGYVLPTPKPVQAFSVSRGNAGDNSRVFTFTDPRQPSSITVTKKDKQGSIISTAPARFGLYVDSNNDGVHQDGEPQVSGTSELNPQWTTTDGTQGATVDGTASWSNLGFGHYVVHELVAPQGYELPAIRDVEVDIDAANAGGTFAVEMQDPKLKTTLTVKKTDEQGNPLADAVFKLYRESNNVAGWQSNDAELGDCTTAIDGTCTLPEASDSFEITWPNTYYWVEVVPPPGYSLPAPDARVQTVLVTQANISDPFPVSVFKDPKPDIETHATAADLPEGTITDYADLTGVPSDAAGTLTFKLYGPFDTAGLTGTSCVDADKLITSVDVPVAAGPGRYPASPDVVSAVATKPGTYYWYVAWTSAGDMFGSAVEPCGSPNEVVTVNKAAPVITTQATRTATYLDAEHGTIQDEVSVRPVSQDATGNLVVSVYGPSQSATPDCSGSALQTWTATRTNADASMKYSVTSVAGKYQIGWTTPALAAPGAGYYFWKATYAGDANNESATHACGEISETRYEVSHVDKAPVTLSTSATPSSLITPAGTGDISDEVFVKYNGVRPTGTVTVTLYGPLTGESPAQSCATTPQAHAPWVLDLTDDGTVVSDNTGTYVALTTPDYTPTLPGTYRWAASYGGDKNYLPKDAVCPDPLEVTTVSKPALDKSSDPATVATAADGTPTLVLRGSTIGYTLTVTNTGDAPLVDKPLVDTLPDKVSFTAVTGSTPLPTQGMDMGGHATLTWLVSLEPGQSKSFTYNVVVKTDAPAADLLVNTARFLGLQDTTTHQVGVPVPTLDKSSPTDGQLVRVGDTIHYEVVVGNTGNYPITSRPLVDTLPDGVTYVSGSATSSATGGGSVDAGPATGVTDGHNTLTWTVTLPAGSTATVEFDALVTSAVAAEATLTNKATFEQLVDTTVHHTGHPTPTLDKSSPTDGQLVRVGDTIHYEVVVGNTGNYPITSRPLVDTLPDGVTYVSGSATSSATGGGSVDAGPATGVTDGHNTLTWTVTLPAGSTATVEFDALVTSAVAAEATLTNKATFEQLVDTTVHHTGHPTPTLDKSSPNEGATVPLGSTIHYTLKVGNTGDYPITGRPVVDTLPDGVTYVAGSATTATSGGGTASAAPTTGSSGGHNTLTWTVTLPPGATATFEFSVTVNANNPRGAELRNTAAFENLTDFTVHYVGIPSPTLDKFSNPATNDTSPTIVQPGARIDYSVKVGNTGNFPITNAPVVDTLPSNVTVVAGTISDGGTLSGDGKTITWTVTLAPAASKTFTYSVTVNQAAPQGSLLVNTAKFQGLTDTTTHVVPTGALTVVKSVSPVEGNGVVVEFGDKLTYTLTASATGSLDQPNVVVTDYLPGADPARPKSGDTTYVAGTAKCIGAGTCTVTGPDAKGLITWKLGDMAAGTSRQVTFQVTIDDVAGEAGETIAADILNAGAVRSDRTPSRASNEVVTPVTKVLAVKTPRELPHTGGTFPLGLTVGGGVLLLGMGCLLLLVAGRRRIGAHRR